MANSGSPAAEVQAIALLRGFWQDAREPIMFMRNTFVRLAQVLACMALALSLSVHADDKKADPAGTWTWTSQGRDGNEVTTTLKLKNDAGKLTGKISGRQGNESDISDAKLEGENISFKVVRERNGNTFTQKYNGKISGDTIKGKREFSGQDGQTQTRDWEAKRKKE